MKTIYEFLLWNNCGNNCKFCHQRAHERKIDDKILIPEQQVESLNKCKEFLESDKFIKGSHILLVGGEIFDVKSQITKKALIDLLKFVKNKMCVNEIDLLYINTNLLYEDIRLLEWFLALYQANGLIERIKFTTSYDIVGRFNSKDRERLFYRNLKYITDTYPKIHIVVNTVLTNAACERICNDTFGADYLLEYLKEQNKTKLTIQDWMDYFRVEINTIPYIKLDCDIAPEMPTKNMVFNTLLHVDKVSPGYLNRYADNIALTQKKELFEYNKKLNDFIYCSSKLADCGHSVNFQLSFADSDECFPCAIKKLVNKHKLLIA